MQMRRQQSDTLEGQQTQTATTLSECQICFSDFESKLSSGCNECDYECTNQMCQQCLSQWIIKQIHDLNFNLESNIFKCPNEACKKQIHVLDKFLQSQMDVNERLAIEKEMTQKYLQISRDTVSCPKCNTYFIGTDAFCKGEYNCLECQFKWIDKSKIEVSLFTQRFYQEIFTYIFQIMFTQFCPKCGIGIQKNGGCLHMTCKKCDFEFCWLCKQNYNTHEDLRCVAYIFLMKSLTIYVFFNILVIFNSEMIFYSSIFWIISAFFKFIYYNLFILIAWFILSTFYGYIKMLQPSLKIGIYQKNEQKRKCLALCFIMIISMVVFLGLTYFLEHSLTNVLTFCFYECIAIAAAYLLYKTRQFFYQTWLKYVY
ncbi:hypothetical protein ABPG74_017488 [Tetrahymena malaccensis]